MLESQELCISQCWRGFCLRCLLSGHRLEPAPCGVFRAVFALNWRARDLQLGAPDLRLARRSLGVLNAREGPAKSATEQPGAVSGRCRHQTPGREACHFRWSSGQR